MYGWFGTNRKTLDDECFDLFVGGFYRCPIKFMFLQMLVFFFFYSKTSRLHSKHLKKTYSHVISKYRFKLFNINKEVIYFIENAYQTNG